MKHKRLLVATVLMANLVIIALAMQVVNLSAQVEQWRHDDELARGQRDAALELAGRAVAQAGEAAPSALAGQAGEAAQPISDGQKGMDRQARARDLEVQLRIVRQGDGRMLEPARHPDILRQLDEML